MKFIYLAFYFNLCNALMWKLSLKLDRDFHKYYLRFLKKEGLVKVKDGHDVIVEDSKMTQVKNYLNITGIHIVSEDILELKQEPRQRKVKIIEDCFTQTGYDFERYHHWETIESYIECLAIQFPQKVVLHSIGTSSENRTLKVVQIKGENQSGKKSIFIEGGSHAREWISPATTLFIMHKLLLDHQLDCDVYILPILNPDGYSYSMKHKRMWRKTRRRLDSRKRRCFGVDLNRNFSYKWGGRGASLNKCQSTYRGPTPFSEPESRALRDFIMGHKELFKLYLAFHSYGQFIMYPWGFDTILPKNHEQLQYLGEQAAIAVKEVTKRKYKVGSTSRTLYRASGGSDDWAMGTAGIEFAFTIELPDKGRYGFDLPSKRIKYVVRDGFLITQSMMRNIV